MASNKEKCLEPPSRFHHEQLKLYCADEAKNRKEPYRQPEIKTIQPVSNGIMLHGERSDAPLDEDYPDLS